MRIQEDVQGYIARQSRLTWRRMAMRRFIRTVGFGILWNVQITGTEHIPASGPLIVMMNHISAIDPVLCMGAVRTRFVIPMTKAENIEHPIIGPLVWWWGAYAVRRGEVDRKALTNSIALLQSGQCILIAPEGQRQPEGLQPPKDGLVFVATRADAVVLPVGISGAVGWEKKLKRFQRPRISIHFGRPFRFKTGAGRIAREVLAAMSHEAMQQLALAIRDENLRGIYREAPMTTPEHLEFV